MRKTKAIKKLEDHIVTLQQLRACDADLIKTIKIEALAHLAEAVSKTVLSADRNL